MNIGELIFFLIEDIDSFVYEMDHKDESEDKSLNQQLDAAYMQGCHDVFDHIIRKLQKLSIIKAYNRDVGIKDLPTSEYYIEVCNDWPEGKLFVKWLNDNGYKAVLGETKVNFMNGYWTESNIQIKNIFDNLCNQYEVQKNDQKI